MTTIVPGARIGNLGYAAFVKEATVGTPLTPTIYTYLYNESMTTELNLIDDNPVAGEKFARIAMLQGTRSHTGSLELYGDPNTLTVGADMLAKRGSVTGGPAYTWPFTFDGEANSYTCDISYGNVVVRYWGMQASKLGIKWDKEAAHTDLAVSALGSFHSRKIASVSTITLTLDATYDPAPNKGLVVNDIVRIYKSGTGAILDTTIASVNADGVTITLGGSAAAFAAGDILTLRPATPSFSLLTPLLWGQAQFCTGATASAALSATQTRVEQGSDFSLIHKFESDKGSNRSGGFDPAVLLRLQADGTLKIKRFFDTPEDLQTWEQMDKTAWVLRFYQGAANVHEFRVTFNNCKLTKGVKPKLESAKILYSEEEYTPIYDSSDGAGVGLTIINTLTSF